MTPEEFTKRLPPLTNDPARSKPPFVFKNLSVRLFPLRASLDSLQQVCDSYLNFVPAEVARFRVAAPYAYLALLDYGQIAELVDSIGWFAQAEVYFGIPVEWYQFDDGQWVFKDWAVITPFIYVDDDFSAPLGRAVFGFPKTLARITKTSSEWLKDPTGPVKLASVETRVFPELYKGRRLESRVFLEVERAAPMSNFQLPLDPDSPIAPWTIASRIAEAWAGFGRDLMRLAQAPRIFDPSPADHPAFGVEMLKRAMPAFMPTGTGAILNSINLKQFRSSGHPFHICYQALTNAGMQTMAFNGGGMLGEERVLLGDQTGGYTIRLHEYSSLPIAKTLGLDVDRRWRGADGVDIAALSPVMPFWINVNVKYLQGSNLCWRTGDGLWYRGNGERLDPFQEPTNEGSDATLFNTTVASAVDDAVTGPFHFTGTTLRVLPLLARRKKLEAFLDEYVNNELQRGAVSKQGQRKFFRLSLWNRPPAQVNDGPPVGGEDAYVYVTADSFGGVTSKTNDVGDWAKYELAFLIPVKFECKSEGGDWEVQGVGLAPAYSFVDDSAAAVSRTEVLGIRTLRANFQRPENVWLQEGEEDLNARQTVLRVDAEVYTAFHVGQGASIQPLLEIRTNDDDGNTGEWPSHAAPLEWAERLRLELGTKNGTAIVYPEEYNLLRALALEILGNRAPITFYTLKQFPDVADPGKACYQSLTRVSRVFEEVFDVREIEETLRVRIHDFPSLSLVETLGIVATPGSVDAAGVTYETQAIRPFYIRASVREELGEQLIHRTGIGEWEYTRQVFQGLLGRDGDETYCVDRQALRMQDLGDPCRISSLMYQASQRRAWRPQPLTAEEQTELLQLRDPKLAYWKQTSLTPPPDVGTGDPQRTKELESVELLQDVTKAEVRTALALIDPQMVIESILSREWGNFDENTRWRRGRQEVLKARQFMLSNQSTAFSNLKLRDSEFLPNVAGIMSTPPANRESVVRLQQNQQIEIATEKGRQMFADCEEQLFKGILETNSYNPGRRDVRSPVESAISRMKEFTRARLELEDCFAVLAAWNISRTMGETQVSEEMVIEASELLPKAISEILNLEVIGEPSPYNNIDVQILADRMRLASLLRILQDSSTPNLRSCIESAKAGIAIGGQEAITRAIRLTEQFREAVQLAIKACNVQREALVNGLSRAYQKPDFCVRRDCLGPEADKLLPLALSWDAEWYAGNNIRAAILKDVDSETSYSKAVNLQEGMNYESE